MSEHIASHIERMTKSVSSLKDELNTIRTGRASASLFDKIRVDYYGDKSPLSQVATISIPEARLVVIQPWDKALIGEIEKAIQKSELSLNPSNDGKVIRIAIPPLTEERRKELVKQAKKYCRTKSSCDPEYSKRRKRRSEKTSKGRFAYRGRTQDFGRRITENHRQVYSGN